MLIKNEERLKKFQSDVRSVEQHYGIYGDKYIVDVIKNEIIKNTSEYFRNTDFEVKEILRSNLINEYNLLYYYQSKLYGIDRAYSLDSLISSLPDVYIVDEKPERFEINDTLLSELDFNNGLTMEEALELLKWTVNNTRDNLNKDLENDGNSSEDVYDNYNLLGTCGFSQFSSLYPLQQLGLEITINNTNAISGGSHAYGTVLIPIKTENKIEKKRFLIDCTYRQFFTIPYNNVSRYFYNDKPFPGYFISSDQEYIKFSRELLKNGFVEASYSNIEKYLQPFFANSISFDKAEFIDQEFRKKINIFDVLNNIQTEFDYLPEEFKEWGYNLEFNSHGKINNKN